ncbi:MAG: DNA replication/repair protein RecF [Sporolactobacillus sp.]|nr:DNA replication/repair protein RecF [Sporolactobacillus sp.]
MKLKSIELVNFRNYDRLSLAFSAPINVFVGENAQGKTNLLEAIYVLAMAKSPRTSHDKELIKWDADYGKIKGIINKGSQSVPLELIISAQGKKARANHLEKRKLSDYIGLCNVVIFTPEDLALVKDGPARRRRFINMEMGQIAPVYIHTLSEYQKVLQQRNALLRHLRLSGKKAGPLLDILTEKLIELGAEIVNKRRKFVDRLNEWAAPIHREISQNRERLRLIYRCSAQGVLEDGDPSKIVIAYQDDYRRLKQREIDRGVTLLGPQRDDLEFRVNDRRVQTFGSQGQQRTAALSVKLAEIELIKHEVGEYPLLLLDDVLSELDDIRKTHLLGAFRQKVQTFVTTTSVDGLDRKLLEGAALFRIHEGKLESVKTEK